MRLIVIGYSGSMSGRFLAALACLLQADGEGEDGRLRAYSAILDFGPGTMDQLLNYPNPADLDVIVFDHLRTDHCADIIGMQVYRRWLPGGPPARIPACNPGDGQHRTRQLGGDPDGEAYEGEFELKQIGPGDVIRIGPMKLEAFIADHTVPCAGLRVSRPSDLGPGKVILGHTGGTDLCDTEVEVTRGVDLLLSECALEDGRDSVRDVRTTNSRAGELTQRAGVARLLLTHLQSWTDSEAVRRSAKYAYEDLVRATLPGEEHRV